VVESYDFFRPKAGTYTDVVQAPAVVLSHSCDFTKYRIDEERGLSGLDMVPLIVAPVVRASQIPDPGTVGHARRDRVSRYFHLPPEEPLESEDHFVGAIPAPRSQVRSIPSAKDLSSRWPASGNPE
jgi:hypothetical protein